MLKKYSFTALEKTIKYFIDKDPNLKLRVQALSGKCVAITVLPLKLKTYIIFENDSLRFASDYAQEPDTQVSGDIISFLRLLTEPHASSLPDKIQLSGDVELAQQLNNLFSGLEIDWEGELARYTGDAIAYHTGNTVKQLFAFQKQFRQSIHTMLNNYLHEEVALFPPPEEINDFFHDIDQLSLDVERLQAKINQLMASK